ncbi:hypothetical protein HPB48_013212 [Haemaphysalis longicornis]|uniref:Monocarboxylate transporter n=1 Tax=Haemaphysalis longicornis TaxID=44386 RepID=A0A9J6GR60_HAELO|nr:hypothetical protein HPB48_013212 [Haemaphysalis longicornis]
MPFITGAGHGAILTCFGLYSMLYFDKYKATATGVKFAALATSGLAAPAIMSLLVNRYGLSGALLLSGAIAMNAAPLVMLIKQPRPFKYSCFDIGTPHHSSGSVKKRQLQPINAVYNPQLSKIMLAQPVSVVCPAEPSAHMAGMSAKSAAEMLLLPEFYVLIVAYFVSDWTDAIHGTTVVDYGRDKGAPLESANYLQTYGAVGELLGRIVIPCLSDKVAYGHSLFATGSLLWSSMTLFGMTFSTSYASFASFNALLGASQGYVQCMRSVLVTDYLGLERLPLFYGCVGLLFLPISLGSPNILGEHNVFTGHSSPPLKILKLAISQSPAAALLLYRQIFVFIRRVPFVNAKTREARQ